MKERQQGLLWAPRDGHLTLSGAQLRDECARLGHRLQSEWHRRLQTQTPGAIGFHDSSRSLGDGGAWICSPLNYSSGIRKTRQHLSLPWRPRLIPPPRSGTLREPEIIPGAICHCPCPCPPRADRASQLPYKGTAPAKRCYFGERRGDRECQGFVLCTEPSHSGGPGRAGGALRLGRLGHTLSSRGRRVERVSPWPLWLEADGAN